MLRQEEREGEREGGRRQREEMRISQDQLAPLEYPAEVAWLLAGVWEERECCWVPWATARGPSELPAMTESLQPEEGTDPSVVREFGGSGKAGV